MVVRGFRTIVALTTVLATLAIISPTAHAATSAIAGTVFEDANRNGIKDLGESPFAGMVVYLLDGAGTYLSNRQTDASGRYIFGEVSDGTYFVSIAPISWNNYKNDWVPTTTSGLRPERTVAVPASGTADFGLRRIQRTTDFTAPITSYQGPNGLKTRSCDDVVSARAVFDAVILGKVGAEAPSVTIFFDCGSTDGTTSSTSRDAGAYSNYSATIWTTYAAWIDYGDQNLMHEYGHAWSLYYAYIVQQDPTLSGYLKARGLTGDSRLETSHAWDRKEMIAEDYRQLFGTANARSYAQENSDIPAAADVEGLYSYLADAFTRPSDASATQPAPQTTGVTVTNLRVNPNPVKTTGTISFDLSTAAAVTIKILDSKGAVVRTLLVSSQQKAGALGVTWDKITDKGRKAARGTYSAVVTASDGASAMTQQVVFQVS